MHRFSPGDSLSKITGNAKPFFGTDSEHLTLSAFSTVRQQENYRNVKLEFDCVKTVELRNFLWMGKEKCGFICAQEPSR
jgi:hypothetical protein